MISQRVFDLMAKIDRKNYVPEDIAHSCYSDIPRPIGFNTTISAPHMHAMTLERLKDHLKPGGKALDIGTGSGYIAASFAEAMGKGCKVYMVDHIKDIMDFALSNIKKGNFYLLKQKRIIPIIKDGRKGIPEHGPYDVIHVGGAIESVTDELLN
jgi:protein-L-isoaspartate(D-aspartate) O-methyltransferase